MRVLAHPDPFVLEDDLLERVAAIRREDALARVLVIVPSSRLADHVGRRVAGRLGACLAVEILHHRGLALRILEDAGLVPPTVASRTLLETLLTRALASLECNPLAAFVRQRPGAAAAILATILDLREAGIHPSWLGREARGERERALAEAYEAYLKALSSAKGLTDAAGIVEAAIPSAERHAARYARILHHGAYELIGAHLDLLRALDRAREVEILVPVEPGSPTTAFAERFARDHLAGAGGSVERLADRPGGLLGPRLAALHVEGARMAPLPEGRVVFRHAQGERAELAAAVRFALQEAASRTSPEEIAVVARDLTPYAPAIEEALREADVPLSTSATGPLRREPPVRDLLALLLAAAANWPRARTAELLASETVPWERLGPHGGRPPGDLAEVWSRRAGVVQGLEAWTRDLPAWVAEARPEPDPACAGLALEIAGAVGSVALLVDAGRARTWSEHAAAIESLASLFADARAGEAAPRAIEALRGVLREMRRLEDGLGDSREVPFDEMASWLGRAVDEAELPLGSGGGIAVLDAMQARFLTRRRVFLIGMHAGLVPRLPREDPFLSDDTRERLRSATARPLPVKREGADEERLLLALVLGSAAERLDVSWQRADSGGRTRSLSLSLRDVLRVAGMRPVLRELRETASALPSHPRSWLESLWRETGMLSPHEGTLLTALAGRGDRDTAARIARREIDLLPRLKMLLATESFAPGDPRYDGRIGAALAPPARFSVTALEQLGRCPLRFFFRHVLRVRELEEPAAATSLAAREVGERVHALLAWLYPRLGPDGTGPGGLAKALPLLEDAWRERMAAIGRAMAASLPVLWEAEAARWRAALEAFLRADLAALAEGGWRPARFEDSTGRRIEFGTGAAAEIDARFDRVSVRDDAQLIGDYKTAGRIGAHVDVAAMLKGRRLQVPLYRMLAGEGAVVEVLGVGPEHDPATGADDDDRRGCFEGFATEEVERGFLETGAVLLRLAARGCFPLRGDDSCARCPYRPACRKGHPPTLEREEASTDARDYRLLQEKTTRRPTIAAVLSAAGGAPEEDRA